MKKIIRAGAIGVGLTASILVGSAVTATTASADMVALYNGCSYEVSDVYTTRSFMASSGVIWCKSTSYVAVQNRIQQWRPVAPGRYGWVTVATGRRAAGTSSNNKRFSSIAYQEPGRCGRLRAVLTVNINGVQKTLTTKETRVC